MPHQITIENGDAFDILERAESGEPIRVRHAEDYGRGSILEAHVNQALAVDNLKRAVRSSLPPWLQRLIPEPRR